MPSPPGALLDATDPIRRLRSRNAAWVLTSASLLTLVETVFVLTDRHRDETARALVLAGLIAAATVVAAVLERAPAPAPASARAAGGAGKCLRLADAGRALAVLAVLAGVALPPPHQAMLAALASAVALIDALGRDRPGPLWALPVTLPWLVVAAARTAEVSWPSAGIALAVLAAVGAGTNVLAGDEAGTSRWGAPLLGTSATAALGAVALTAGSPSDLATVLIILGTLGVMLGAAHRQPPLTVAGGLVAGSGIWLHLLGGAGDGPRRLRRTRGPGPGRPRLVDGTSMTARSARG